MAEVKGCGGSLTFTNLTAGVKAWTLNHTLETLDTTDFADACVKTFMAGFSSWTATATANWDAANTADVGDSATLTLTITSGKAFSGTALLVGVAVNTSVDGIVEATYSFQGSGALTYPS